MLLGVGPDDMQRLVVLSLYLLLSLLFLEIGCYLSLIYSFNFLKILTQSHEFVLTIARNRVILYTHEIVFHYINSAVNNGASDTK